jgi:hypothetical protein
VEHTADHHGCGNRHAVALTPRPIQPPGFPAKLSHYSCGHGEPWGYTSEGHGYNYIFIFATQGAWRIPAETVCSFQAAILANLQRSFRGRGSVREQQNRSNRRGNLTCGSQQLNKLHLPVSLVFFFRDLSTRTESL